MARNPNRLHQSTTPATLPADYPVLLRQIKARIRAAQMRAAISANSEMIRLYWDIGRVLVGRRHEEGWGAKIVSRLAIDLRNELPDLKGFSPRNLMFMAQFFREYPALGEIVKQAVSQLARPPGAIAQQPVSQLTAVEEEQSALVHPPIVESTDGAIEPGLLARIPWGHHVILIQRIKDLSDRLWYMRQTVEQGWSRSVLTSMIEGAAHRRQGQAVTNFDRLLPPPQSDLARQALKDPYIFDFLTLEEPFHERELETGLLRHVEKFLLELGQGFAFVGRQFRLEVGEDDFYLDLLFYHLHLRCFVVIDLKKGPFKAEYAGKMNFYCNVVDDRLRHPDDAPTIGLILCQDKNRLVAEYALKGVDKAIGVSKYQITRALPARLQSSLPSIAEIEAELSAAAPGKSARPARKSRKVKGA